MGNVIPLTSVSVSDLAKSMLSIESERLALDAKSAEIASAQAQIWSKAMADVAVLSQEQTMIMQKRIALDEVSFKLLQERIRHG